MRASGRCEIKASAATHTYGLVLREVSAGWLSVGVVVFSKMSAGKLSVGVVFLREVYEGWVSVGVVVFSKMSAGELSVAVVVLREVTAGCYKLEWCYSARCMQGSCLLEWWS